VRYDAARVIKFQTMTRHLTIFTGNRVPITLHAKFLPFES
jgi:hypothetical protein